MIILPSLRLIILLNLRIISLRRLICLTRPWMKLVFPRTLSLILTSRLMVFLRRQEHIPKTQKMTKKWRSIKQAR